MMKNKTGFFTISALLLLQGCSSTKSFLAIQNDSVNDKPIENPFGNFYASGNAGSHPMILRTKKGDRSVEVEFPQDQAGVSDFVVPMSPSFQEGSRGPASLNSADVDSTYKEKKFSSTDREITQTFPQGQAVDNWTQRNLEGALGLMSTQDPTPTGDFSYLAGLDHVKQLFKNGRFEAALLELDEMVKTYPTDPKIFEMRGTILDRIGYTDLALKSWKQALEFNPNNSSLKKFIEKKELKNAYRKVASP